MAVETTLKSALERIDEAFADYAEKRGWGRGDYRILYRYNDDWDQLHVVIAVKDLDPARENLELKQFLESIRANYGDIRSHFISVFWSIRSFAQLDGGGIYGIGPDFSDAGTLIASGSRP